MSIYKKRRTKLGQEVAAAKVGISVRSARRLDGAARDAWLAHPAAPFEALWRSAIVPLLAPPPALTATTLLKEMQGRHS